MGKIDRYKKKHKESYKNRKSLLPLVGQKHQVNGEDGVCVKRTPNTATILTLSGLHTIKGEK